MYPKTGIARSADGVDPSSCGLALVTLTVQLRLDLGDLERPTRIAVFQAQFCGLILPILRNVPLVDGRFFLLGAALTRRSDQAGVGNLAGHRDVPGRAQALVEAAEQSLDRTGLGEFFPEEPNCARVVHAIRETQP